MASFAIANPVDRQNMSGAPASPVAGNPFGTSAPQGTAMPAGASNQYFPGLPSMPSGGNPPPGGGNPIGFNFGNGAPSSSPGFGGGRSSGGPPSGARHLQSIRIRFRHRHHHGLRRLPARFYRIRILKVPILYNSSIRDSVQTSVHGLRARLVAE